MKLWWNICRDMKHFGSLCVIFFLFQSNNDTPTVSYFYTDDLITFFLPSTDIIFRRNAIKVMKLSFNKRLNCAELNAKESWRKIINAAINIYPFLHCSIVEEGMLVHGELVFELVKLAFIMDGCWETTNKGSDKETRKFAAVEASLRWKLFP